jgi:hypothetical protein
MLKTILFISIILLVSFIIVKIEDRDEKEILMEIRKNKNELHRTKDRI